MLFTRKGKLVSLKKHTSRKSLTSEEQDLEKSTGSWLNLTTQTLKIKITITILFTTTWCSFSWRTSMRRHLMKISKESKSRFTETSKNSSIRLLIRSERMRSQPNRSRNCSQSQSQREKARKNSSRCIRFTKTGSQRNSTVMMMMKIMRF